MSKRATENGSSQRAAEKEGSYLTDECGYLLWYDQTGHCFVSSDYLLHFKLLPEKYKNKTTFL